MSFKIPSIFTAVDKFSAPVQKMGEAVTKFANKSDAEIARLQRRYRKLSNQAFSVARKGALIGAAVLAPLGVAAKHASDFESKMSNVATLIDTNTESITKMGEEVLSMATKLPVPVDELVTSLYDIRSAGISANDQMAALEQSAILAKAGLSTTEEATSILTSAMNAFASEGLSAEQITDTLFKTVKAGKTTISQLASSFGATAPIVQAAGVKLADFQAATAALTTVGTPATQAQTQLRAAVVALQKPTAEMTKIFQRLGVTSEKELIKKFGGLGGAFEAVNKAGTDMGLNLAKAWSSVEAGAAVTSITGATNEAYVKTLENMTNGANAVSEAFEKQSNTTAAQAQLAQNNLKSLSITLGATLLPLINSLLQRVIPIVQKFAAWIKENKGVVETVLKVTAAVGGLAFVIAGISGTIGAYGRMMDNATTITKAIKNATWLWEGAQTALNIVLNANPIGLVIAAVAALAAGITWLVSKVEGWGEQWDSIVSFISYTADGLKYGLKATWGFIEDAFLSMVDGIVLAWKWGQNMIGAISDEEYANEKARIKEEQKFRTNEIRTNALKAVQSQVAAANALEWKLKWKDDEEEAKAANPELATQEAFTRRVESVSKQNVAIDINDRTGMASVNNGGGPIPVNLTSTVGAGGTW